MARVTYVKAAQQRYATVPVLDENGEPKRTPVMRRGGTQKTTKTGRPVFMTVTEVDKSRPLPNRRCELCGAEITVGSPYKHVTPKSSPYGGQKRVRCATCPTWQVWELSGSLSARVAEIEHHFTEAFADVSDPDEARAVLEGTAEEIKNLAEEKREGASNIEDGFGHPTSASEELEDIAVNLESWADEIADFDVPDLPDPSEVECEGCEGTGEVTGEGEDGEPSTETCEECGGSGHPDEVTDDQVAEWRDGIESGCGIFECPV